MINDTGIVSRLLSFPVLTAIFPITLIFNSTCETITQEHLLSSMSVSNCVSMLIFAVADLGISKKWGVGVEST